MRTRLLLLLLAWLLGMGAGVFGSWRLLWVAVAGLVIVQLLRRTSTRLPLAVASLALFGLGMAWAGTSVAQLDAHTQCTESLPLRGTIVARTKVTSSAATYQFKTTDCLVVLRTAALPLYTVGDDVQVNAQKIESVAELAADLPGYAQYLSDNHVQGVISYPRVEVLQSSPWWRGRGYEAVRRTILSTFSEPETSFVLALLLGEQGETPSRVQENFQATGLTHILSISGMNISLLTGILLACLLLLPIPGAVRVSIVLGLLWSYIGLISWPVSAVRAALFWTLTLLAVRLNRLVSLPTAFILTSSILLSANPVWLRSISWQLSFGAIAGIAGALFIVRPYLAPSYRVWRVILAPLAPSIGATVITWPVIAYHFGTVSTVTLLANLLTEPVMPVLFLLALTGLFISWLPGPGIFFFTYGVHVCWLWLDYTSSLLARLPYAFLTNIAIKPSFLGLYYALLIMAVLGIVRFQQRSWREVWQ